MSIATEIEALQTNLASAKTAVQTKGGTVGDTGLAGLADEIATIPTGGGVGIPREVSLTGVYQTPSTSFSFTIPEDATDVGNFGLYYALKGSTGVTSADLSSLTSATGSHSLEYCFNGCTNLTSVNLHDLVTVSGSQSFNYTFDGCTNLTSVDLSSLTTISASNGFMYAFRGCTSLSSISLPSLTTLSGSSAMGQCFNGCTALTSITFTSLEDVNGGYCMSNCFEGCTNLTTVSFPALTWGGLGSDGVFNNMLRYCSGVTVHFPVGVKPLIQNWSSVTNGFGGTNTTVLFDL